MPPYDKSGNPCLPGCYGRERETLRNILQLGVDVAPHAEILTITQHEQDVVLVVLSRALFNLTRPCASQDSRSASAVSISMLRSGRLQGHTSELADSACRQRRNCRHNRGYLRTSWGRYKQLNAKRHRPRGRRHVPTAQGLHERPNNGLVVLDRIGSDIKRQQWGRCPLGEQLPERRLTSSLPSFSPRYNLKWNRAPARSLPVFLRGIPCTHAHQGDQPRHGFFVTMLLGPDQEAQDAARRLVQQVALGRRPRRQ